MHGKRTVLVLDADPSTRSETERLLTQKGYGVLATGSAREAAGMLKESPVACAVVDVELEDMDGLDALSLLREIEPQLRVVVTAAQNTKSLEARVRQQDVVYYYVKNFEREELIQAVSGAAGGGRMGKKAKILVVDDDADYQAAVKQILEDGGYEVVQAYTKTAGLEAVKKSDPDLIILDIMMTSTTDGFHFLYELKADSKLKKRPVLSVSCISEATGFDFSPTDEEDYFPADDFMTKPVEPQELLSRVGALLGKNRPAQRDG